MLALSVPVVKLAPPVVEVLNDANDDADAISVAPWPAA